MKTFKVLFSQIQKMKIREYNLIILLLFVAINLDDIAILVLHLLRFEPQFRDKIYGFVIRRIFQVSIVQLQHD